MPENSPLRVGEIAPDFEVMNQDRQKVKLSEFRGKKKVVLLFYPLDFSPTCTEEHCTFSKNLAELVGNDAVIFGINCDHSYAHAAYKKEYNIAYDLLSDTTREVVKKYGMYAGMEPYNCSKRGTVVIDKTGKISMYHEQPMREARSVEDVARMAKE